MGTRILAVDNYDSFVWTIVGYLRQLGAEVVVVRNDAVPGDLSSYDGVMISPGPGNPQGAGQSLAVLQKCAQDGIPVLGVCLGHQAIGELFGATVTHAPELMHGRTSEITHQGTGVFAGLPNPLTVTRYHSLVVDPQTIPACLEVTAQTSAGMVMALRHRELPITGVQFHPESVLTTGGHSMFAQWLAETGDEDAPARAVGLAPLVVR